MCDTSGCSVLGLPSVVLLEMLVGFVQSQTGCIDVAQLRQFQVSKLTDHANLLHQPFVLLAVSIPALTV